MVMAQIQFSLIKKNKDSTSRTIANPLPFIFALLSPSHPLLKMDVICVSPLNF